MRLRALEITARNRIEAAIQRGELENLPGAGRPFDFDDERHVPPEQRRVSTGCSRTRTGYPKGGR